VTSSVYDADGNKTSDTDANNRTTTYTFDLADRQTSVRRADNTTLRTDYNADNTVADTVDGANQTTRYGYDAQGRRTSRVDPAQHTTAWKLDPAGQLLTLTDAANRVTSYGYDADGNETSVTYSDGVTPNVSGTIYDAVSRRTSTTDGTGTSTWSYDTFGEVTSGTNGAGSTVGYGYDASGNVTSLTYPGGQTVTRGYDKANRLTSVKDWNGSTTSFGYDADGDLRTITYPNGTAATRAFNDADQLTTTTLKAGTTTLASLTSPRDNLGQVSGETPTGVPGSTQAFGYTPLEQVKSATASGVTTNYGYDAADNPTVVGASTQAYDAASRLCWSSTSAPPGATCTTPPTGATTYTYNTVGDRTRATTGATVLTYGYDQASRLTSFAKSGTTATYRYEASGLRASKTVNGTTTRYVWSIGGDLLSDGTTSYVYGAGGLPVEQVGSGGTQWFLSDHLGSTRALVNSSGSIVGGYSYTTWGTVASHTGSVGTPLQYAGQYTDAESGLVYLRARFYDPATCQFLTLDPMVDSTHSAYGYAADNPLNSTDPSGLFSWGQLGNDIWHPTRFVLTLPMTIIGVSTGLAAGGDCDWNGKNWVFVCYGGYTLPGSDAFTLGSAINTNLSRADFDARNNGRLLAHETKHTDQYALLGPAFLPAYGLDTAQAWLRAKCSGSGKDPGCYKLLEQWAGLKDGGYSC
jgi:RHS repeat-associated protein